MGTHVRLSSMLPQDHLFGCLRVTAVSVRGHNNDQIVVWSARVRGLFYLPTDLISLRLTWCEDGLIWNRLPRPEPLTEQNIVIGLLVGYNCPRALAPLEVILPVTDDGPYGQRTSLGRMIIGIISVTMDNCDVIGVCHTTMCHESRSGTHRIVAFQAIREVITTFWARSWKQTSLSTSKKKMDFLMKIADLWT